MRLRAPRAFAEETLNLAELKRERFFRDVFSDLNQGRYRNITMRQLTDRILNGWRVRVREDLKKVMRDLTA